MSFRLQREFGAILALCGLAVMLAAGSAFGDTVSVADDTALLQTELSAEVAKLEKMREALGMILRGDTAFPSAAKEEAVKQVEDENPIEPPAPPDVTFPRPPTEPIKAPLPAAAIPGNEEEFANSLYRAGKYELAAKAYDAALAAATTAEAKAWAAFQIMQCRGRCPNLGGEKPAAAAKSVPAALREGYWGDQISWWESYLSWRATWLENARKQSPRKAAPTAAKSNAAQPTEGKDSKEPREPKEPK